jgi:hypothetical protein
MKKPLLFLMNWEWEMGNADGRCRLKNEGFPANSISHFQFPV